jgi:hypothetical protein
MVTKALCNNGCFLDSSSFLIAEFSLNKKYELVRLFRQLQHSEDLLAFCPAENKKSRLSISR